MLRNNNNQVIWYIVKSSLSASKLRNRFIGTIIFLSAFLLSLSSTFAFNAVFELRSYLLEVNIDSYENLAETTFSVIAIAVIIFFACVLSVYNIFYISIARRIKEYGQLRTIGATTKQISRMVSGEGFLLCALYIPFGIIIGCIASHLISPVNWYALPCLVCALVSGAITFLAVILSIRKPAKFAASVSPIEATCYTGYRLDKEEGKRKKATRRLSPASLGIANLLRSRKKAILTFLSLTLCGILFIGAASVMNSVNPTEHAMYGFPYGGEYSISLDWDIAASTHAYGYRSPLQVDNPFTDELAKHILQIDGITGIEIHKYIDCWFSEDENINIGITNIRTKDIEIFQRYLTSGKLTDNGMIVNSGAPYYPYLEMDLCVGDVIHLKARDGEHIVEMSYEVSAVIHNKNVGSVLYLPDHTIDYIMVENCNTSFEILSDIGYSAEVANSLNALIQNDKRLQLIILDEVIAGSKAFFHVITVVLYSFVSLIGVFAMINLINTIITNALTRKREMGILQAVGLDSIQYKQMIWVEHSILLLGSFITSAFFGSYGGYRLCNTILNIGGFSFVQYQFPIWQITVYFALIIVIQLVLIMFLQRSTLKQSVVERLYQI